MNFIPNSKFYKTIFHLDPNTLAIAKARLNSYETGKVSVISNQTIEDDIIDQISEITTNSSELFQRNYFDSINSSISKSIEPIFEEENQNENENFSVNIQKTGIIAALCEGRGNAVGEIGLALLDINFPILHISQFSDDILYTALITKLQLQTPSEILVSKTLLDSNCKSIEKIQKIFFDLRIIPLPRRHFNEQDGLQMLKDCCLIERQIEIKSYEKKYYAISAASALLKYLKAVYSLAFMSNGLTIKFSAKFAHMVLDHKTCLRLELLKPLFQAKENKACLLNTLDKTVTHIGKRQIQARILEPYIEKKDIIFVQETIIELLNGSKSENIIGQITEILKKFYNVDKILKLTFNESVEDDVAKSVQIMLDKILLLKSKLEIIPELSSVLKQFQSFTLFKIYTNLTDNRFANMLKAIEKVLRPETHFIKGSAQSFQRIHAVRPGLNKYLDTLREAYNNLTDGINEMINQLSEHYSLPLRMTYSISKGFHIQLLKLKKISEKLDVPEGLTLLYERPNAIFLTTNEINKMNVKLRDTANEIYICCEKIIRKLTEDLIQYNEANYLLVDLIANLDIIVSYAKVSQTDGFCCPEFGEETRIVDARHIFLEKSKSNTICVPNNIIATPEYNFFIITGPNMAGKTIYLKMIALIQIIAQLGCFVPASSAKFRICDKIFTRLGFEDKIEDNGSGFINEIREIEYIFRNVTSRSLIIIDELCRTTNPNEGFNLAWKLCSKLCQFEGEELESQFVEDENQNENICPGISEKINFVKSSMPHIYVATHFLGLTDLKKKFVNVINLQVEAEEVVHNDTLSLKYTHKVKEGVTAVKNYGLSLAKCIGIPDEILKDAYDILNGIRMRQSKIEEKTSEIFSDSIEEIEILQKNLDTLFPNKSFEIQQKRESIISISNFMNNSLPNQLPNQFVNIKPPQNLKTVPCSKDLMEEFCFKMYDFYADIAAIQRHTPPYTTKEYRIKVKEIFESVKQSLPSELQQILANKDMTSIPEESSQKNTEQNLFNFDKINEKFTNECSKTKNCERDENLNFDFNLKENIQNENILDDDKNNYGAKVIENIQIIPPTELIPSVENHIEFMDNSNNQNSFNLRKVSSSINSENLNKSFDFGLFKNLKCELSPIESSKSSENVQMNIIMKDTQISHNSDSLRLNQTIDLGDLVNSKDDSNEISFKTLF